jgi:CheY-like chemotaxis protein
MKTNNSNQPARWLVVDDTECVLELLTTLLARLGRAEICRCRSGAEALAQFAAAPESFEFVVTDLEMPGMNGIELCRELHARAPHLKILLATGSSLASEESARQLGFCGLLAKPFPPAELHCAVAAAGLLPAETISNPETALAA